MTNQKCSLCTRAMPTYMFVVNDSRCRMCITDDKCQNGIDNFVKLDYSMGSSYCNSCNRQMSKFLMTEGIDSDTCRLCFLENEQGYKVVELNNRLEQAETLVEELLAKIDVFKAEIKNLKYPMAPVNIQNTGSKTKTILSSNVNNDDTDNNDQDSDINSNVNVDNTNNDDQVSDNWIKVKNGIKPKGTFISPIQITNKFSFLTCTKGTEENEEIETRLVGDSYIGGQLMNFCVRNKKKRKRFFKPNASIDDLIKGVDEFSGEDSKNALIVLNVGISDMSGNEKNPELIKKYKSLIEKLKDRSANIVCAGILPVRNSTKHIHNKSFNFNLKLKKLCTEMGLNYFSAWDYFLKGNRSLHLFAKNGYDLSHSGHTTYGRLLNEYLKSNNFFIDPPPHQTLT